MTKEQAEDLVQEFSQAVVDYERCESHSVKYYREEYQAVRAKLINALTLQEAK